MTRVHARIFCNYPSIHRSVNPSSYYHLFTSLQIKTEKASQELRKKGLAAANKKSSRHAAEGLVGIASSPTAAAIVEINSETDFVARNDQFKTLVSSAAHSLLLSSTRIEQEKEGEVASDSLANIPYISRNGDGTATNTTTTTTKTIGEAVAEVAGTVRENIKLRRGFVLGCSDVGSDTTTSTTAVVGTYIHGSVGPGVGRIASIVLLQHPSNDQSSSEVKSIADSLAMHVVGAVPKYLDRRSVPLEALDAETTLLREQAAQTGKPDHIIEKMVQGRMSKFYEEVCLLEQPFIMDDKKKVKDVVKSHDATVTGFVRVQVGEGLEGGSDKKDFAAEVEEVVKNTSSL